MTEDYIRIYFIENTVLKYYVEQISKLNEQLIVGFTLFIVSLLLQR